MAKDRSNGANISNQATVKNIITVGSLVRAKNQEVKPFYSSEGPAPSNRWKPDIMACGGDDRFTDGYIYSADNGTNCGIQGNPFQGISMATQGCCRFCFTYKTIRDKKLNLILSNPMDKELSFNLYNEAGRKTILLKDKFNSGTLHLNIKLKNDIKRGVYFLIIEGEKYSTKRSF